MIQEDYEEKKNLMFNRNDYSFNYSYLYILFKIKSLKKIIIIILLFATIKITNNNLYNYKITNFHILNKNSNFTNDTIYNNDKINYNNYIIPQINKTINKSNIFFNELNKNNNYSSYTNQKTVEENESSYINLSEISNYTFKNNNYSSDIKFNYQSNKDELFWRNESINFKKIQEEIIKYKRKFVKISFINKEDFYERKNPKISIIITIYNQKEFIKLIYTCIQNQSIKDIEIIFVDDASTDGSKRIIKLLMKRDKRIIYLKNIINKGQYYSRYKGVLFSKGKYIIIIDPDDLLLNDILTKAYILGNHYNLEIVHYYHIKGNFTESKFLKLNISGVFNNSIKKIYYNCSYRYLWDKLILRKTYLNSIKFIKEKYRNSRIIIHNDEVACYAVFRIANSYGILEQVGYFYNRQNKKSITKQNFKPQNLNGRFYSLFTIMEYYFVQSNNNTFEKTMGGYNFFKLRIDLLYKNKIKYLTEGFFYINNVLNLYLESKYFNKPQKNKLRIFKKKINQQKNLILNLTNNNNFKNKSDINKTNIFLF